jgi:transcriptional regulator with XRE-family HTH domain
MDVASAVKELRGHLKESQQAFSNRLGVSLRAVANYEGGGNPTGSVLVELSKLARNYERDDLLEVFTLALREELRFGKYQEGMILSNELSKDEKTWSSYALIDVRRTELLNFLLCLHETLGRYLNPKNDDIKARAKKLLLDFELSARKEWEGTPNTILRGLADETSLLGKEGL